MLRGEPLRNPRSSTDYGYAFLRSPDVSTAANMLTELAIPRLTLGGIGSGGVRDECYSDAPLGAPHRATGEYELCTRNAQGEFVRNSDDARQIEFGAVRRQISHNAAEGAAWKLYHPGLVDTLSRFCTLFHGEIVGAISKRSMKLVDESEAEIRRSRTKFIYSVERRPV